MSLTADWGGTSQVPRNHHPSPPSASRTQSPPTTNRPPTQSNNSESLGFLRRVGCRALLRHLAQLDVHYNPLGVCSGNYTGRKRVTITRMCRNFIGLGLKILMILRLFKTIQYHCQ